MRTLDQAGLAATPFVRAADIQGAIVALTNAVSRDGQYGPEVVFSCRLLADAFDPNGNAIPLMFRVSMAESDGRLAYVAAFEHDPEEIGPVTLVQLAPQRANESGAWVWNDAQGMIELPAAPAAPALAPAGTPNGVAASRSSSRRQKAAPPADDGELEELPY